MQRQLEEQLPMLEANTEQAAAYGAIEDDIDGHADQNVRLKPPKFIFCAF